MPKEAKGKHHRIPKYIRFPFGYTVKVVQKSPKELSDDVGTSVYGYWCDETRTIFISRTLTAAKKRYVVLHELTHALEDFKLFCTEIGLTKP